MSYPPYTSPLQQGGVYAEYYLPGILMSESTTQKLEKRDSQEAARAAPEDAFGFRLFELPTVPRSTREYEIVPKRKRVSKMYYIDATLHSLAEVESWGDEYQVLASNMRVNKWDTVVKCRTGNFQPFESGDTVVKKES